MEASACARAGFEIRGEILRLAHRQADLSHEVSFVKSAPCNKTEQQSELEIKSMKRGTIMAVFLALVSFVGAAGAQGFDHSHMQWSALLKKHVSWQGSDSANGVATVADYAGFKRDRAALQAYTATLAAVKQADYNSWNRAQKQAFLINAYNAYTVELIIGKYPNLKSIKELGSVISSPWSKALYPLLGKKRSLDNIEHDMLRGAADFNEPRIHFAVNCASIGCPALRPEAFVAANLGAQLEDQTRRFLKDRSRNRFERKAGELRVSQIFNWYRADFEKGFLGARNLESFLARYAGSLGLTVAEKQALIDGDIDIDFTEYDWSINDRK
jgi:Protein of unknown function, DUF547